ncbi:gliding motility lipoprotein GldH [Viscerimonas tarda]
MMIKRNPGFMVCLLFVALLAAYSCRPNETYYQFSEIESGEWAKCDTLYYTIDSSLINNAIRYNITLELTHNAGYPYRNIWFYMQDNLNEASFRSYSHQYMLADPFGKWYGSGFGALYQLSLPYKNAVYFKGKRNFSIKIVHGMRDEPLMGIEKAGIKIAPADEE